MSLDSFQPQITTAAGRPSVLQRRVDSYSPDLAQTGGSADWMLRLRPRERAPLEVAARVVAETHAEGTLRWMLRPVTPSQEPVPSKGTNL